MALTNTLAAHAGKQPSAPLIVLAVDVDFDSAYAEGGMAFDAAALLQSLGGYDKAPTVLATKFMPKAGYSFWWDATNKKVVAYQESTAYMVFAAAGLAIGSVSKKKVLIANTVEYSVAGVAKSKTTAEVAFTADDHDITANASAIQEAVYLLSLDASGTATITKGTTASGLNQATVPATPNGETAIGHVRVSVAAGATDFDASSDDLDAAHLTVAYTDLVTEGKAREVAAATDLSALIGVRALVFAV